MRTEPGLADALSLACQVVEEVALDSARDTHLAVVDRVHGLLGPVTGMTGAAHRAVVGAVYAGVGAALQGAARGFGTAADRGVGPVLESGPRSRRVRAIAGGLIGDRLEQERPRLAITMAVRAHHVDVPLEPDALAEAFPAATGRVVVFLHGWCESDEQWRRRRDLRGTTYGEELEGDGWTPVFLRANSGLSVRRNGAELAGLLEGLVEAWPVPVERIALVGHSMGGLLIRAAGAVQGAHTWPALLTDVVTLGTPHLGAPLAGGVHRGSGLLGRLPEVAALGRILDQRAESVADLICGLDEECAALPGVRYRLVSATLKASPRHPVSGLLGDVLVRQPSAYGRDGRGRDLFPGAEVLHIHGGHFDLLNHATISAALRRWLA